MANDSRETHSKSDPARKDLRRLDEPCGKPLFTCFEALVVLVCIGIGTLLLLPAIGKPREAGRKSSCMNKAKQIDLAMQNYASAHNHAFPPSAEIVQTSAGNAAGGYSFLVKLLPYMEYDSLSNALPQSIPNGDIDAALAGNPALANAMNISLKEFVCPSNNNNVFLNPTSNPPRFAFTNYKAMGATTRKSLDMAANPSAPPPYGTAAVHPDGAIFPSSNDLPIASITDGTSHTIIVMETMDDQSSRWMVGAECTLVGLPQASSPTSTQPAAPFNYFAPPGCDKIWGDSSAVSVAGLRTFLMYDFVPSGPDVGQYEDPGWAKTVPAYGPSSAHPAVVIVGMGDGSANALSKRCDAANLFFLITKNGNDPFNLP